MHYVKSINKNFEFFNNPYYRNSYQKYSIPSPIHLHNSNIYEKKIKEKNVDESRDKKINKKINKKIIKNNLAIQKKHKSFLTKAPCFSVKKKTLVKSNLIRNNNNAQNMININNKIENVKMNNNDVNKINKKKVNKLKDKINKLNKYNDNLFGQKKNCSLFNYDNKSLFIPKQMIINPIKPTKLTQKKEYIDNERPIFGNELKDFFNNIELDKQISNFKELKKYKYKYDKGIVSDKVNTDLIKKLVDKLKYFIIAKLEDYLKINKPKVCNNVNKCIIESKKNIILLIGKNNNEKYALEGQLLFKLKDKNSEFLVRYVISNENSSKGFKLYHLKLEGFNFIKMNAFDNSSINNVKIYTNPIINKYNGDKTYMYSSNENMLNSKKIEEIKKKSNNFVNKKKKLKDNEVNSEYRCYNKIANTKSECEKIFDTKGKLQDFGTWDKRCESNEECPFYKKNTNYPNEYGKCINGWCEMPVGVKQLSPRKFINLDKAACHNCKSKIDCCIEQEDSKKYPKLKSPDYYFKNDKDTRLKYKDLFKKNGLKVI